MKLKIVSDGTAGGVVVTNAETGEPIEDVESVEWEWREGSVPSGVIRFVRLAGDVRAEIEHLTD